ncbi:ATP-grasp domain-containing protein [Crassaminicella profunda]|uniref:ATP-grasp domain-containing protein n=1 Tax=Crassaminicella profunda TaxID=1286698 RepID=UPI001CA6A5F0|nr:ATP-grasp domain-containing protein [Crassaminicella profunda]QZY54309.1 ATP-grasp domain-containing protein [Crassaminicella profunda]
MKVLVEAVGSMTFGPALKYYNEMGWEIIGMDITGHAFGFYKNIKPYIVPKYSEKNCFSVIEEIIKNEKIDMIFPTINEGLLEWSKRKEEYKKKYNANVILSDKDIINICMDKWNTYNFFMRNNIPTPKTSLKRKYGLLKPRIGRGSTGIYFTDEANENFDMSGYISQEIVDGQEYTIDVLCDFQSNPVYIIPRKRIDTESGVSTKGVTVFDEKIIQYVKEIILKLKPIGIINIQCFKNENEINFIEINPRIAGGSSLSFASSDNWFKAIQCFQKGSSYSSKDVKYNNYMFRYYEDVIVEDGNLIK